MFYNPKFNKQGTQVLTSTQGRGKDMLMDITVHKLKLDEELYCFDEKQETAILLLKGKIALDYEGKEVTLERGDLFKDLPSCLHFCKSVGVVITALSDEAEVLIQGTDNEKTFPTKLYLPEDIEVSVSNAGRWEDTMRRDVITVFDYFNAPYSNMVLGEIFVPQGRWYSYIPHSHPQPEVYYYRTTKPEAFGACFIDDKAYFVKDGSVGCFTGGKTHSQCTAPGFPMYCCWMIRHLDGNPWARTRNDDPRYEWLIKD